MIRESILVAPRETFRSAIRGATAAAVELYTTANALALAPNEADATTGFSSANPPETFASVANTDSQGGSFMITFEEATGNAGARSAQNIVSDLSLTNDVLYEIKGRIASTGETGIISTRLGIAAELSSSNGFYPIIGTDETDTAFQDFRCLLYITTVSLSYFGWRENDPSNTGGINCSFLSITEPNSVIEGAEQNTVSNCISPLNEANSLTNLGNVDTTVFQSAASTDPDSAGGSFELQVAGTTVGWRAEMDIQLSLSLVEGRDYLVTARAKHSGSGGDVMMVLSEGQDLVTNELLLETTLSVAEHST